MPCRLYEFVFLHVNFCSCISCSYLLDFFLMPIDVCVCVRVGGCVCGWVFVFVFVCVFDIVCLFLSGVAWIDN